MYIKKEWVVPIGIGVASFTVGVVTGYFFRKIHKEFKYAQSVRDDLDEVMSDQIKLQVDGNELKRETNKYLQETKRTLIRMQEVNNHILSEEYKATPLFEPEEEIIPSKERHPSSKRSEWEQIAQVVEEPMVTVALNEHGREIDPNWNYDDELERRRPDKPYIIHRDEFFSQEMDFEQTTLMYYRRDDTLCDEADVPVPNYERLVGKLKFGHGSLDPSICYVRNENISHEWEIILDEGSFAVEVLGADMEKSIRAGDLKHSVPKFRQE